MTGRRKEEIIKGQEKAFRVMYMFHQYIHISEHQILPLKYVEFIVSQLELNDVKKRKKAVFIFNHIQVSILFITHLRPVCLVNLTISLRASSELD